MRNFIVPIELSDVDIEFLKSIDWKSKNPQVSSNSIDTPLQALCEKGVLQEVVIDEEAFVYLTEVGDVIMETL